MSLRIGSLFSGYGGLDIAVQSVLGGEVAWYSEIDKAANVVLAARHPGVPNLGDITTVDWATVPPVDILTGGYPCQPFSHAGQRKGTDDERHLWPYVRDAIAALRPVVTVLENVDGHRSLGLADVLGDLADLGLPARWGVVRAADAGAPHGRKRIFIVVGEPADAYGAGLEGAGPDVLPPRRGAADGPAAEGDLGGPLPEPAADAESAERRGTEREHLVPAVRSAAEPGERAGTPADAIGSGRDGRSPDQGRGTQSRVAAAGGSSVDWGRYAPAIARWERALGRPAPAPTVPGVNARPRLSPMFVEWMMGLDLGHVTGHGLRPAQCLKMLGNGVVPQQAALALRMLGLGGDAVATPAPEALLPAPTVMDMGANYTPEQWAEWKDRQKANHGNGNGHGASLTQEAIAVSGGAA